MAINGKQAQEWIKPLMYITAAYLGWRYAVAPLLEGLNLKETQEDKAAAKIIEKTESAVPQLDYWRTDFHARRTSDKIPVKDVVATFVPKVYTPYLKKAMDIWDATGFFNDVESKIYGVFRTLQYKIEVSYLASIFQSKYKRDLYQFLKSYLDEKEMAVLLNITDKLPYGWQLKNGKII